MSSYNNNIDAGSLTPKLCSLRPIRPSRLSMRFVRNTSCLIIFFRFHSLHKDSILTETSADTVSANISKNSNLNRTQRKFKQNHIIYLDLARSEIVMVVDIDENNAPEATDTELETIIQKLMTTPATANNLYPSRRRVLVNPERQQGDIEIESALHLNVSDASSHDDTNVSCSSSAACGIDNRPGDAHLKAMQRFLEHPRFNHLRAFCNVRNSYGRNNIMPSTSSSSISQTPAKLVDLVHSPAGKYSFLVSLIRNMTDKSMLHPIAIKFRDDFHHRKQHLAVLLLELYRERLSFEMDGIEVIWSTNLYLTDAHCVYRRKSQQHGCRTCTIQLSVKNITNTDRLRCTLIRELCKAIDWMRDAKISDHHEPNDWLAYWDAIIAEKLPELYPIEKQFVCRAPRELWYKYAFECTLCGQRSQSHWQPQTSPQSIRCVFCLGGIVVINQLTRIGVSCPTIVSRRKSNGFGAFVQKMYRNVWQSLPSPQSLTRTHAETMQQLSIQYAKSKK